MRTGSHWYAEGGAIPASIGVAYVGHVVKDASATNGVFALVLGLLAFFYITAVAVVLCAEINVVRVERPYPRALLTPFTDNVVPTSGDHRAYTGQAVAERSKGFENIRRQSAEFPATGGCSPAWSG
jgi:membrane protein